MRSLWMPMLDYSKNKSNKSTSARWCASSCRKGWGRRRSKIRDTLIRFRGIGREWQAWICIRHMRRPRQPINSGNMWSISQNRRQEICKECKQPESSTRQVKDLLMSSSFCKIARVWSRGNWRSSIIYNICNIDKIERKTIEIAAKWSNSSGNPPNSPPSNWTNPPPSSPTPSWSICTPMTDWPRDGPTSREHPPRRPWRRIRRAKVADWCIRAIKIRIPLRMMLHIWI